MMIEHKTKKTSSVEPPEETHMQEHFQLQVEDKSLGAGKILREQSDAESSTSLFVP